MGLGAPPPLAAPALVWLARNTLQLHVLQGSNEAGCIPGVGGGGGATGRHL
jgi:hypothetical protein